MWLRGLFQFLEVELLGERLYVLIIFIDIDKVPFKKSANFREDK